METGYKKVFYAVIITVLFAAVGCSDINRRGSPEPKSRPSPSPVITPVPATPSPSVTGEEDPFAWDIEEVCIPVDRPGLTPKAVRDLGDGTYVYRRPDGSLFRGTANRCRCLSSETLISTPGGDILIRDLKPGMSVFTWDRDGNKVVKPIELVSKVPVPGDYPIFHLVLNDGRELFVSGGHPAADSGKISDLKQGDMLDGAELVSIRKVRYRGGFTYDILPSGETGYYRANGILLGSTLSPHFGEPLASK